MNKRYYYYGCNIRVKFEKGIIRLYNDIECWIFFDQHIKQRTQMLVELILKDYEDLFNEPLSISSSSLKMEIWGHLYYEYYVLRLLHFFHVSPKNAVVLKLIWPSQIIDCGVQKIDRNRWLWDLLAPLAKVTPWFLPTNISKRNIKVK